MDIGQIEKVVGLASAAIGMTGKAATTAEAIKKLFSAEKAPERGDALKLVNDLAVELTSANMTNFELSNALKMLSQQLRDNDKFEREADRYELFKTEKEDVVYKLRDDRTNGQPMHFICPVCMQRDKLISFLKGSGDVRVCQTDTSHNFRFSFTPLPPLAPGRGGGPQGWMSR